MQPDFDTNADMFGEVVLDLDPTTPIICGMPSYAADEDAETFAAPDQPLSGRTPGPTLQCIHRQRGDALTR